MNQRIDSIEMIRGLAILGVVGIHTGSFMTADPSANIHLFALLEIISRFSVPIFFFASAFSLFRQYPLSQPFDAGRFYRRRLTRVLFPYIAGSILYMLHYSYLTADWSIWFPILIYQFFFFGMACYQLYFLVILLWFYLLMPLWRLWVRRIVRNPAVWLCLLFFGQMAFNYYSSYQLRPTFTHFYVNLMVQYRMSWWLLHYLFLFLLGGVVAVRYEETMALLRRLRRPVQFFFVLSMASMLGHYYYLLFSRHYSLEQTVNTVHQLSPAGMLYTLAACLYFLLRFETPSQSPVSRALKLMGRHSYGVFWIHPVFMHYFHEWLTAMGGSMTVPVTLLFYTATVAASLGVTRMTVALRRRFQSRKDNFA